ncbi:MAG: lysophospholipid acyltransferase family protein [Gemmatimonadaceae bacterium]
MNDVKPVAVDTKGGGWRTAAIVGAARVAIRILALTWRITVIGREELERLRASGRSSIVTFWHGQILSHAVVHRLPSSVLISDHRDGEIIAQIVRGYGMKIIRGSSSKGGARALLQLARELNGGEDIVITPDGPRGPRHSFALGALKLAQRTGAPLVLMGSHASRLWRLKTWDQFEVPKPFARVTVIYSPPLYINAGESHDLPNEVVAITVKLNDLIEGAAMTASSRKS